MKCPPCPCGDAPCRGEANPAICSWSPHAIRVASGLEGPPGVLGRAGNFYHAILDAADGGFLPAPGDVVESRLESCRSCELSSANGTSCRLCGCHLAAKVSLAAWSCPLDPPRWGPYAGPQGPP